MSRSRSFIQVMLRYLLLVSICLLSGCQSVKSGWVSFTLQAQDLLPLDKLKILEPQRPPAIRARAHFMRGKIHEMEGNMEEAIQDYSTALKLEPENFPLALKVARGQISLNNNEAAIRVLEKSASQPDAPAEVFAWLGFAYSSSGNIKSGKAAILKAIELDPLNLLAYQTLAEVHIRLGETEAAQQVLDQALSQEYSSYSPLVTLVEFIENVSLAEAWSPSWTRPRIYKLLKILEGYVSDSPLLLVEIADRYWNLGESERAIMYYYRAIDQFPSLSSRRRKLLAYFMDKKRWEEALDMLNREAATDPENPLWDVTGAEILNQLQQFEAAENKLREALVKSPESEPVYLELARTLFTQSKLDLARDAIFAAEEKFGQDFDRNFLMAFIELNAKQHEKAAEHIELAEKLGKEKSSGGLNHVFYFQMAVVYEAGKNYEKASEALLQSLNIKSNFAEAMNFLGYMWADKNMRLPEARVWINKAVKLEPDNPAYQDSMAWVLFRQGDYEGALTWINKSKEGLQEPDPVILEHLGDIQWKLGQKQAAIGSWKEALKLDPENSSLQQKIKRPGFE